MPRSPPPGTRRDPVRCAVLLRRTGRYILVRRSTHESSHGGSLSAVHASRRSPAASPGHGHRYAFCFVTVPPGVSIRRTPARALRIATSTASRRTQRVGRSDGRCARASGARAEEPRCGAVVWQGALRGGALPTATRVQLPLMRRVVPGLGVASEQRHAWAGDASLDRRTVGPVRRAYRGETHRVGRRGMEPRQVLSGAGTAERNGTCSVSRRGRFQPPGGAGDGWD